MKPRGKKQARLSASRASSARAIPALSDILGLDPIVSRPGVWTWWFWLFFLERKDRKPEQLMVLWSGKDEEKVVVNNLRMTFERPTVRKVADGFDVHGAVAAWYYDGKKLHDEYLLSKDVMHSREVKGKNGKTSGWNVTSDVTKSSFTSDGKKMRVNLPRGKLSGRFTINFPPDGVEFLRLRHSQRAFMGGKFLYNINKFNRLAFTGQIGTRKVKGSAYFQRVTALAPAVPWYWTNTHLADGSVFHYFIARVGLAMLRENGLPGRLLEQLNIFKGDADLWYAKENKRFFFDHARVRHLHDGRFHIHAWGRDGDLRATLKTAGVRPSWKFQKRGRLGNKMTLRYNEYPSTVEKITLTRADGKPTLTLADFGGRGQGNAEHAWGTLI